MQYDAILIRLGELFLKGKNRQRFVDRLFQTAKNKLAGFPELKLEKERDHFMVMLNGTDCESVLKQLDLVFGIHSYALGTMCESDMDAICATALPAAIRACKNRKSIKFESKRNWKKFGLNSIEISQRVAQYVGTHAPEGSIKFNVKQPDLVIRVFVKEHQTLIVSEVRPAAGGLPIGLNGRALLMLSGGLDSPVAGYFMMKRGLVVEGIHFESPPYTTVRARQKVYDLAEKMAHYLPRGKMLIHIVPFTKLQRAIFDNVPESYGMTVMRRMMYRVTEHIANDRKIRLLANGESLGQVASQTPDSMWAINAVTHLPVIRPLACMDKVDIMETARRIDTYDISIRPFEDCCTVFVPKYPSTSPSLKKCEKYEGFFDWAPLVEKCAQAAETVTVEAGKPIRLDTDTTDEICSLL
ncbi:tRNA 4-thiouridine(8) synthase ThiI [Verrucomicrobia bacterium S94]|nr:tRNA 4-thiouridine(8) synthase ThiI [Verrucomicrobia bacterium S94]